MRILIISLNAFEMNTSAMLRNKALVSGLLKNKAEIDFLTIPPVESNIYYDDTNTFLGKVNLLRLGENKGYNSLVNEKTGLKGVLKKQLLKVSRKMYHKISLFDNTVFIARKVKKVKLVRGYYDVIISSSDPKSSHIVAHNLIKAGLKYGKWIQYWGDPMSSDITQKTIFPKWYVRRVEAKLFSCSDKIVYVSPFTLQEQKRLFHQYESKMEFLPIPYLEKKYYDLIWKSKEKLELGYFGDYNSEIRDIMPLYNFCKKGEVKLTIAGSTNIELKNDENVQIYPRVGRVELDKFESECDILVCILNKSGTQIPGKIYHYAATNKPILIILDGDNKDQIKEYLLEFKRFILCENNENSIRKALNDIQKRNQTFEPSTHFDSKVIAKKILEI